jgi:hypothetical protein
LPVLKNINNVTVFSTKDRRAAVAGFKETMVLSKKIGSPSWSILFARYCKKSSKNDKLILTPADGPLNFR